MEPETQADRIYLKRIEQFFTHTEGNSLANFLVVGLMVLIFQHAGVGTLTSVLWVAASIFFNVLSMVANRRFQPRATSMKSIRFWLVVRMSLGVSVISMYGLALFLLPDAVDMGYEMMLFVIIVTVAAVSTMSHSGTPVYCSIINLAGCIPLVFYFSLKDGDGYWQALILTVLVFLSMSAKAWRISRTSIGAIILNEKLLDEIEQHQATKEQLHIMATRDHLTGLPNRRMMTDELDLLVRQARRNNRSMALMFIDLDGFKLINDNHGHDVGDAVLKVAAQRLRDVARDSDLVARLGGDEFVLVYTELKDRKAEVSFLAERILEVLGGPMTLPNGEIGQIGASIGISIYPDDATEAEELLKAADNAMYKVKASGKNNYCLAALSH